MGTSEKVDRCTWCHSPLDEFGGCTNVNCGSHADDTTIDRSGCILSYCPCCYKLITITIHEFGGNSGEEVEESA